jgi:hypothetical protein
MDYVCNYNDDFLQSSNELNKGKIKFKFVFSNLSDYMVSYKDKYYKIKLVDNDRVLIPDEHFRFGYCKFKEYKMNVKAGRSHVEQFYIPNKLWNYLISFKLIGNNNKILNVVKVINSFSVEYISHI